MLYTPMMYAKGMSEEARAARKARSLLGTEGNAWDAACVSAFGAAFPPSCPFSVVSAVRTLVRLPGQQKISQQGARELTLTLKATVFLLSPHSRWVTGTVLAVDAGTTAAVGIGMTKA